MRYWLMALREGNRGDDMWPDCFKKGIAAIGYADDHGRPVVTDCSRLSLAEYDRFWQKKYPRNTSGKASLRRLAYEMQPGDTIYVRGGMKAIVGKGKIINRYKYDPKIFKAGWEHYVKVEWEKDFPELKLHLKTPPLLTVFELVAQNLREIQTAEDEYFTKYEPDDDYQTEVQQASPKVPSAIIQKPKYTVQQGHRKLITSPELAAYCLAQAGYRCEANHSHTTFISKASGKNYVEAHHLIPLKRQAEFPQFAIDNQANIIALCPNCHRLLHYATATQKEAALRKLFDKKRERILSDKGMKVTVDEVLGYY